MNLDALQDALRNDPDDDGLWRVYADARRTADTSDPWARAIEASLGGQTAPPTHPALVPPEGTDVVWHRGMWKAVRISGGADPVATALAHPSAVLVTDLVLYPLGVDRRALDQTVVRSLRVPGSLDGGPRSLDFLAETLQTLIVDGFLGDVVDWWAPSLRVLHCDLAADLEALSLPRLQTLRIRRVDVAQILALAPSQLPALTRLEVRAEVDLPTLERILNAPIGRQLKHLEVRGPLEGVARIADAWGHLDLLVIDVGRGARVASHGSLRVRTRRFVDAEWVRLCGGGALAQARAFAAAAADLGFGMDDWPDGAIVAVPPNTSTFLARRMAVRSGLPVESMQAFVEETTFDERGRCDRLDLHVDCLRTMPDGTSEVGKNTLTEVDVHCIADTAADEDLGRVDDHSWLFDELLEHLDGEIGLPEVWTPVGWVADPYTLARVPEVAIRRLIRGHEVYAVSGNFGAYLCWRADHASVLVPMPPPDLRRWTRRLLRRHGLEREPDEEHAYWRDWADLTRDDRSRRGNRVDGIPRFKIMTKGRWILDDEEARALADALRRSVVGHYPPDDEAVRGVPRFLDGGAVEVEVG